MQMSTVPERFPEFLAKRRSAMMSVCVDRVRRDTRVKHVKKQVRSSDIEFLGDHYLRHVAGSTHDTTLEQELASVVQNLSKRGVSLPDLQVIQLLVSQELGQSIRLAASALGHHEVRDLSHATFESSASALICVGALYHRHCVQSLQESDSQNRDLIDAISDGIFRRDHRGRLTYFNDRFAEIFGYPRPEMKKKTLKDIIHPEDYPMVAKRDRLRRAGKPVERKYVYRVVTKNGDIKHLEVHANANRKDGRIIGTTGVVRDVTHRIEMEKKLEERFEKMQAAYKELGSVNRKMASLMDISSIVTSSFSPEEIFDFVIASTVILAEADTGALHTYNQARQELKLVGVHGFIEDWKSERVVKMQHTLPGQALREKIPMKIANADRSRTHTYSAIIRKHGLKSVLAIPLLVKGKPVGTLSLLSKEPNKFDRLDQELISALISQAAIALKFYS